jgi:hypothetical protein
MGKLNVFHHVSLEIRDGSKFLLGYAPLREKRTSSGSIAVNVMANRAFLDKITVGIVVGPPTGMSAYELRVKDLVGLTADGADKRR